MKGVSRRKHLYSKFPKLRVGNALQIALSELEKVFLCHRLSYVICPRSYVSEMKKYSPRSLFYLQHPPSFCKVTHLFQNSTASHFSRLADSLQILNLCNIYSCGSCDIFSQSHPSNGWSSVFMITPLFFPLCLSLKYRNYTVSFWIF